MRRSLVAVGLLAAILCFLVLREVERQRRERRERR